MKLTKSYLILVLSFFSMTNTYAGKESLQIVTSFACDAELREAKEIKIGIARIDKKGVIHITDNMEPYKDCIELTDGITGEFVFDESFDDYRVSVVNLEEDDFSLETIYTAPTPEKTSAYKIYLKTNTDLRATLMFKMADYPNSYAAMWTDTYIDIREKLKKEFNKSDQLADNGSVSGRNDPKYGRSKDFHAGRGRSSIDKTQTKTKTKSVNNRRDRDLSKTTLDNQFGRSQTELIDYVEGKRYYFCEWDAGKKKWNVDKNTWREYKVFRKKNGDVAYIQQVFKDIQKKMTPENFPHPTRYDLKDRAGYWVTSLFFYKNYRVELGSLGNQYNDYKCSFKYFYCSNPSELKKKTQEEVWDELCEFGTDAVKIQDAKREADKQAEALAASNKRAAYSIENKTLKDLEVEFYDNKAPYIGFNITAILEDGTRISTKDGGYLSDYNVNVWGGDKPDHKYENGKQVGVDKNKIWTRKFYCVELENDQVVIEVKSRFHDFSKRFAYTVKGDQPVAIDFSGANGYDNSGWPENCGQHAPDLTVEVNWCEHKTTGEKLVGYAFYTKENGQNKLVGAVKLKPGIELFINGSGGDGKIGQNSKNSKQAHGGDGGNGSNIKVWVDPSVKGHHNIRYDVSPGGYGVGGILLDDDGGFHDNAGSFNGKGGKKGSFSSSEGKVVLPAAM